MFLWKFPGATKDWDQLTFTIGENGTADSFTLSSFGLFTRIKE